MSHIEEHCSPNGDMHTLTPGCSICESYAERPHELSDADLRSILAKFTDTGVVNGHARTNLDVLVANAFERARAICRTLGLIEHGTTLADGAARNAELHAALFGGGNG